MTSADSYEIRNVIDLDLVHVLLCYEVDSSGEDPLVVETIPGWAHDITNSGDDELVVMLWANEIFDRNKPDTVPALVGGPND